MGAFFLVNEPDAERSAALWSRLSASMSDQGFAAPQVFAAGPVRVAVYGKLAAESGSSPAPSLYRADDGRTLAYVGTAVVDGRTGAAAAQRMLARVNGEDEPAWQTWLGQFCVLLTRGGGLDLFLDPLGVYKVYRRADGRVYASSFLAVASTLEEIRPHTQGVYEFLAQEATYGRDTVLEGVELARSGGIHHLDGGERFSPWPQSPVQRVLDAPLEVHVERLLARLGEVHEQIADAYGDRIDTALSGGYDSRLLLALLHARGVSPEVHVYGAAQSDDVRVARSIAEAEGFDLQHVDKGAAAPVSPDDFAAVVARNYRVFDGYPGAGLFEGGVDLATRLDRARGGHLMLNGGGGEVLRNFFYLPDRRFSAMSVVHSFYNRYAPVAYTDRFDESCYQACLRDKILAALGQPDVRLDRIQVERVYPEFRCRYWMGRNNAINTRLGDAITPFVEPVLLPLALEVPLSLKNHGRLEAAMIARVSPSLARHTSDYGHAFDVPPPRKRVLKDQATLLRPPWVRRLTYRLRYRRPSPRGRYLTPEYLQRVIDPDLPRMREFLVPHRCHDPGMFQRACTLEYLFQSLETGNC